VLIEALEHHRDEVLGFEDALGRIGPRAAEALPALRGLIEMGSADPEVVEALVRIDPHGTACLPALVTAMSDEDSRVVDAAARALGVLGPRAKGAVAALAAALAREFEGPFGNEGNPRVDAAKALGRIGPEARPAIPALIRALRARLVLPEGLGLGGDRIDYESAEAAARVLGSFGPAASEAVPVLIEVARRRDADDDDWTVRFEAALALGRIGPAASDAVTVLREMMREFPAEEGTVPADLPYPQTSDAAVVALSRLDPEGEALAEAWAERSGNPFRRAFVLGGMGRRSLEGELIGRRWLEELDGVLEQSRRLGDDLIFVEGYFERLGSLGAGAAPAVPRLEGLLRDENPWIRQWAGEALERITRNSGGPAVPTKVR
jgi:HEAT repeat protein